MGPILSLFLTGRDINQCLDQVQNQTDLCSAEKKLPAAAKNELLRVTNWHYFFVTPHAMKKQSFCLQQNVVLIAAPVLYVSI